MTRLKVSINDLSDIECRKIVHEILNIYEHVKMGNFLWLFLGIAIIKFIYQLVFGEVGQAFLELFILITATLLLPYLISLSLLWIAVYKVECTKEMVQINKIGSVIPLEVRKRALLRALLCVTPLVLFPVLVSLLIVGG